MRNVNVSSHSEYVNSFSWNWIIPKSILLIVNDSIDFENYDVDNNEFLELITNLFRFRFNRFDNNNEDIN